MDPPAREGAFGIPIRSQPTAFGIPIRAYYDVLSPSSSKHDEQQKKSSKQALLEWIKTIKNLRDPLSHPSERDFSFEDSFMLLDCARRVLSQLKYDSEAKRIHEIM